jgi:hypothetical protein
LVALELVNEDTSIAVVVNRAHTAAGEARRDRRAVGLVGVMECSSLVGPGASAALICALVALKNNNNQLNILPI